MSSRRGSRRDTVGFEHNKRESSYESATSSSSGSIRVSLVSHISYTNCEYPWHTTVTYPSGSTSVSLYRLPCSAKGNARHALPSPDSEDGVVLLDRGEEHLSPLILGLMEAGFIRQRDQYTRASPRPEQFN